MSAILFSFALLAAVPGPTAGSPHAEVTAELRQIEASVQTLVQTTTGSDDRPRLLLLLRRAELTEDELVPVNAELLSIRRRLDSLEETRLSRRLQMEALDEAATEHELSAGQTRTYEQTRAEIQGFRASAERLFKGYAERLAGLEADYARKTAELESIKAAIDRMLFAGDR